MRKTFLTACALAMAITTQAGTKVQWNEVPEVVRQSIQNRAGAAEIEDVDKDTANGKSTYEAAYKKNGKHVELLVSEDGKILNEASAGSTTVSKKKSYFPAIENKTVAPWNTLPPQVKSGVIDYAGKGTVTATFKGTVKGQTVYQADFNQSGQPNSVYITEQGGLLAVKENQYNSTYFVTPLVGATEVQWSQIPEAVQKTLTSQSALISDIRKGTVNDVTFYEASLYRDGKDGALRIREDGSVFRQKGPAFGKTLNQQAQTSAVNSAPATKAGSQKMSLSEIPKAAQNTIQQYAAGNPIEDVDRNLRAGQVTYEAAFKKNGVHNEIVVAADGTLVQRTENGSIVKEPAGAQAKTWENGSSKVTFEQLPAAVQQTFRNQAGSASIEDIDRETRNGKTTFEGGFKKDGKHTEVKVSEDGTLISVQ